jgi:hypothetical protein
VPQMAVLMPCSSNSESKFMSKTKISSDLMEKIG